MNVNTATARPELQKRNAPLALIPSPRRRVGRLSDGAKVPPEAGGLGVSPSYPSGRVAGTKDILQLRKRNITPEGRRGGAHFHAGDGHRRPLPIAHFAFSHFSLLITAALRGDRTSPAS